MCAKPLEHLSVLVDVPLMRPLASPRSPLRRRARPRRPAATTAVRPRRSSPAAARRPDARAARPPRRRPRGPRALHVRLRRGVRRRRADGRHLPRLRRGAELVAPTSPAERFASSASRHPAFRSNSTPTSSVLFVTTSASGEVRYFRTSACVGRIIVTRQPVAFVQVLSAPAVNRRSATCRLRDVVVLVAVSPSLEPQAPRRERREREQQRCRAMSLRCGSSPGNLELRRVYRPEP